MGRRSSEGAIAAIATAEVQGEVALVLGFHEAERRREGVAELGDHPVDEDLRDGILGPLEKFMVHSRGSRLC